MTQDVQHSFRETRAPPGGGRNAINSPNAADSLRRHVPQPAHVTVPAAVDKYPDWISVGAAATTRTTLDEPIRVQCADDIVCVGVCTGQHLVSLNKIRIVGGSRALTAAAGHCRGQYQEGQQCACKNTHKVPPVIVRQALLPVEQHDAKNSGTARAVLAAFCSDQDHTR